MQLLFTVDTRHAHYWQCQFNYRNDGAQKFPITHT